MDISHVQTDVQLLNIQHNAYTEISSDMFYLFNLPLLSPFIVSENVFTVSSLKWIVVLKYFFSYKATVLRGFEKCCVKLVSFSLLLLLLLLFPLYNSEHRNWRKLLNQTKPELLTPKISCGSQKNKTVCIKQWPAHEWEVGHGLIQSPTNLVKTPNSYRLLTQYGIMFNI